MLRRETFLDIVISAMNFQEPRETLLSSKFISVRRADYLHSYEQD